jgi:pSer/pThr/pTyr-binding forkhead associated (FHA) protein/Fe-S-cluster-containing hydrogenase component 2/CRP-like cAMP-binding protein
MVTIHVEDGSGRTYSGKPPFTIGRDPGCELQLTDEGVSRRHLAIRYQGGDLIAEDLKSSNGTFLVGPDQRIERAILRSGDVLVVGKTRVRVEVGPELDAASEGLIRFCILEPTPAFIVSSQRPTITIGRHPSCDVVIPEPTVSRRHAAVVRTPAGFVINDQTSVNAVFVGTPPQQITAAVLHNGDEIRLGKARLRVEIPGELGWAPEATPIDTATLEIPLEVPRPAAAALQARLARTPLFQVFTDEDWKIFLGAYERDPEIHVERYVAGQTICEAGTYDLSFCLVLHGTVDAFDPGGTAERIASFRSGDFFGLIEAKRALPRIATLVAASDADVLYVPRHHVRYIEHNASARALLATHHKEEAWRLMATQLELFQGVSPRAVAELFERSEILFYDKAGIVIVKQGSVGESLYLVRDGFLQVVQHRNDGTDRVMAYLRPGEFFGETALLDDVPRTATVLTAGRAEVVKVDRADVCEFWTMHPEFEQRLRGVAAVRMEAAQRVTPELSNQLKRWGQGYVQADALLVMDLELCVKCDLCVDACAQLHGESRLIRHGMQLGKYLVPAACRHCDDPLCMFACPTGAVRRRPEGEIHIQYDLCIGCGACAIACPYDNIEMIETNKFDQAQARKQAVVRDREFFRPFPERHEAPAAGGWLQRLGIVGPSQAEVTGTDPHEVDPAHPIPPRYPIKCDLCDGLPFMGCVHACPTGAAMRVDPRTILQETGAVSVGSQVNKASPVSKA